MALNHVADGKNGGKSDKLRQIFTFFIEDMMFGLDVENVLMLDQEVSEIQRIPIEERGFCGVTKFQGTLVPVLDFAHRIGVASGMDSKTELLEMLTAREKDHLEWMTALEKSLNSDEMFVKEINPDECEFGKWYNKFETRDETLGELLELFGEPHQQLHNLAETLLEMKENGDQEGALEKLAHERVTTLRRLRALFSRARDQIQGGMRQVLLFVTQDGKTPRYALVIDDINDVINYTPAQFQSSRGGALGLIGNIEHVIEGIYTREETPDCLYFDINKMTDTEELMAKVS